MATTYVVVFDGKQHLYDAESNAITYCGLRIPDPAPAHDYDVSMLGLIEPDCQAAAVRSRQRSKGR